MESDQDEPPIIYPRNLLNHKQPDTEPNISRLQSQSSHLISENPFYEKVKSKKKNGRGQKILCCTLLVCLLLLAVAVAVIVVVRLTVTSSAPPTNSNHTEGSPTYSERVAAQENNIKAVGYGDIVMNLFAGEAVHPWVLKSSHGNCSLHSKRFIIAQPSGTYHISCKVELRKKAAKLKLKMIRNGVPFTVGNFDESTGEPLLSILESKIYLKTGDRLSIVTGNNTAVFMRKDTSHFQLKQIL